MSKQERRECGFTGSALGSTRSCELEAGHKGPHGCTKFGVEGDEWVTLDDYDHGAAADWYAYLLWGRK